MIKISADICIVNNIETCFVQQGLLIISKKKKKTYAFDNKDVLKRNMVKRGERGK